uniref:Uncharacterized protein n=1 Tax=Aegilops tauschii subsp. strangulata TaxID=200361 RepID=A0A453AAI3_AEGTS
IVSPIGFNLIFPGMFNHAIRMGLECPVRETDISGILHLCEMELRRCVMKKCCHVSVARLIGLVRFCLHRQPSTACLHQQAVLFFFYLFS